MTLVIGVDPHKQTHTAAAVRTGSGELVDERTAAARPTGYRELLAFAQAAGEDRLWAVEDVRGVSRGLERFLLSRGERVVRVPPKLMAGARKSARAYGKSDSIDAARDSSRGPGPSRSPRGRGGSEGARSPAARQPS